MIGQEQVSAGRTQTRGQFIGFTVAAAVTAATAAFGHVHWLGRIFHAETLGARRSRELDLPCARLGIGYRRFLGDCHADA